MMEKLVIQVDKSNIPLVDNFLRAICDNNHIVNYYATISVPIMKAMEVVERISPASSLSILFDYLRGGITFTVQTDSPCFLSVENATENSDDEFADAAFLITLLSDHTKVTDEGRTLQIFFDVRGIDASEAFARVQVLEHFYESIHTKELQTVE